MSKKQIKKEIEKAIELHEKMKNSFFWSSPAGAASRRSYEKYNSNSCSFEYNNNTITVEQNTSCSCKNIYYTAVIKVNGIRKDIRALKKVLKDI